MTVKLLKNTRQNNSVAMEDSKLKKTFSSSIKFVIFIVICSVFLPKCFELKSDRLVNNAQVAENSRKLRYWNACYADWNDNGHLRTMNRVFDRLGYEHVNASNGDDWDVLWTFEYPFDTDGRGELFDPIFSKPLKPHQRINHFVGVGGITNKSFMTTINRDLPFILPSFHVETKEEFEEYIAKNVTRKFVEKNYGNRGVKIIDQDKINLNKPDTMFQAFMDKPFLIDGHAFDMGIYVLVSSVDPLRVYRWNTDILVRFCPLPYHPFDPSNVDKYVIYETHKHFSQMPSFKKYLEHYDYPLKVLFANYLEKRGLDIVTLWKQIDEAIATVLLRNEHFFVREGNQILNSTKHSFELLRFDFLVDEALRVYLMEVNLSPNITPTSEKFERNAKIREQMVYDSLRLIGANSYFDLMNRYDPKSSEMMSHLENIAVNPEACVENFCHENCHLVLCELCSTCLGETNLQNLHEAHLEHKRRGGFKRIFPRTHFSFTDLTPNNKVSSKWFAAKCFMDPDWC